MVHVTCTALHCSSSSRTHDVKFHQLPHDPNRRKLWLIACKRTDVIDKESSFFKHKYVCSLHFHKCMYTSKDYLRKTAVPSLDLSAKPIQHDSSTQTEEFKQYVMPYQNFEEQQYHNNLSILNVKKSSTSCTQIEDSPRYNIYDVDVKEEPELFEPDVEMKPENNDDADYEDSDLETSEEGEDIKPDIGETEILPLAQSTQPLQSLDSLRYNIHHVDVKNEKITQTNTEESQPFKPDAEIKTENADDVDKNIDLETSEEDVKIQLEIGETEIIPLPQSAQFLQSVNSLRYYIDHVGAKKNITTHTKYDKLESFKTGEEIKSENNVDGNSIKSSEEDLEIKPEILPLTPGLRSVNSQIMKNGEILCTQSKNPLQEINQDKTSTIVTKGTIRAKSINTNDASVQTDRVMVLNQNPDGSVSVNSENCTCEENDPVQMSRAQFYRCCKKFLSPSFCEIVRKQVYLYRFTKHVDKELSRVGKTGSEKLVAFDFLEESAIECNGGFEKSTTDLDVESAVEQRKMVSLDFDVAGTETAENDLLTVSVSEADSTQSTWTSEGPSSKKRRN